MDPLSITGLAISCVDIAGELYDYISTVKSAKDDIRKLSQELFALKGTLDQFVVYRKTDEKALQSPQMEGMVELTRETLNSIRKRLDRGSTKLGRAMQSLAWPFKQDEVNKLVSALERAKTWFIMVIMQDNAETTSAIYDEMKRLTNAIHEDIIARRLDRMMTETQEIIRWLAPVDSEEDYQKATRDRVPGTGSWFFDKSFESWAGSDCSQAIMWITGKSGAGKTTLFSGIVEEVRRRCSESSDAWGCGFHYCSWDNSASQLPSGVFGSVLAQLVKIRPELVERVRPLKERGSHSARSNLNIAEIVDLATSALNLVGRFYVLIDALNETSHQNQIVPLLLSFCRACPNIRVLVTCTSDPQIQCPELSVMRLSSNSIDRDIGVYVRHRLYNEPGFSVLSDKIKERILKRMLLGADGTFRWAQLCMDRLASLRTGRDVLTTLSDLPATLNETYARILQRVPQTDVPLAYEALTWLAFSTRPLRLQVLSEAMVIQESDRYLDDDCRLSNPSDALDICVGLAQVDDGHVTLAHDSIRSFLTSSWIRTSPVAHFALDSADANRRILRKCLSYLGFNDFAQGHVTSEGELAARLEQYPLLEYAAAFWPEHLVADPPEPQDETLILDFFATKANPRGGCFGSWVQFLLMSLDIEAIQGTEPLYYAASYNMVPILKILLKPGSGVDINRIGGRFGSTPLAVACFRGYTEAATMLLKAGADPNVSDGGTHRSAYSLAKYRNMYEVVRLMDELGVNLKKNPPRVRAVWSASGRFRQNPPKYDT